MSTPLIIGLVLGVLAAAYVLWPLLRRPRG